MPRKTNRFWLAALITAWSVDFLFFAKSPGISFLIWVVILLLAGLWLARSEGVHPAPMTWVMMGLLILTAAIPFVRVEPFTVVISILLSISGLVLLAATYRNGNWLYFRTWDTVGGMLTVLLASATRPFGLFKSTPADAGDGQPAETGRKSFWKQAAPVLRGLLLALPVVGVLAVLLSAADMVFADRLKDLFSFFNIEKLPEYIFRMIYILVLTFLFAGVYLHALLPTREAARPEPDQPVVKPFLGWIESVIVLGAVVLLFAFFVGVQFWYLFGGEANITAAGYTYSEYARRGFSELVAVAVLSLLLTLTLGSIARREGKWQGTISTVLTAALLALVLVILGSALQRLLLYEQAYGFTRLRTYTLIFIPWLALLLLAAIGLEIAKRGGRFGLALLIAAVGFGLAVGAWNVDGFIARQNIERGIRGEEFDRAYLGELSTDAVPAMLKYYQQPELDDPIRTSLGAELSCHAAFLKEEGQLSWKSWTISRVVAENQLSDEDFSAYPVDVSEGVYTVTIGSEQVPCIEYGGMD